MSTIVAIQWGNYGMTMDVAPGLKIFEARIVLENAPRMLAETMPMLVVISRILIGSTKSYHGFCYWWSIIYAKLLNLFPCQKATSNRQRNRVKILYWSATAFAFGSSASNPNGSKHCPNPATKPLS